jgi:hypothetical protein
MKTNTVYTTVEVCAVPEKGNVLSDQIISVPSLRRHSETPVLFRRIEYWNADKHQGSEANRKGEFVPRHQRQRSQDADMDGVNRHADPEVSADEIQLRLVAFQSGRSAASTAVHLQRLVGLAQHSSGRAASRKATLRTVTDAAEVVRKSWTAANQTTIR